MRMGLWVLQLQQVHQGVDRWGVKNIMWYDNNELTAYGNSEHFTDIGLPSGQTHDGTWNVNNWVEWGFRVFDSVFLDTRKNKRWDGVYMMTLIADMFVTASIV